MPLNFRCRQGFFVLRSFKPDVIPNITAKDIFYFYRSDTKQFYSGMFSVLPLAPYIQKKKNWIELELNPGPISLQLNALTTIPWLLGHALTNDTQ